MSATDISICQKRYFKEVQKTHSAQMYPNLFKTKEKEGGDRVERSSLEKDGRCCPEGSSVLEPAAGRRRATEWAASATALHVEIEQTTTRHGRSVLQRTVRRNGVAWVWVSMWACMRCGEKRIDEGKRERGEEGLD